MAWASGPAQPENHRLVTVVVRPGDSAAVVGERLRQAGLIRSALWFALWSRLSGGARDLKAGVYRFSPSESPAAMLQAIVKGQVAVVRVTIPEGWTVRQVVARLVQAGVGTPAQYRRLLHTPFSGMPDPAPGVRDPFEGYLFPATYAVPWGASPRQALAMMWQTFSERAVAGIWQRQAHPALSLQQWVTLASLVQAESDRPKDDPLVAAVFWNRLKRGMPLQSDATVRYALSGQPPAGRSALAVASPYNTYLYRGLPPGPIDNPGLAALEAALHPARVGYLYFVSTPEGHLVFATTYQQQLAHIAALRAPSPSSGRSSPPP
ncbi:MAG: endolytic transglycosylase MltG [Firmicutes bacterium]|nr:endolytic transglycosylase MltG [Alicyclobacillaceae bacterium]MCL6496634.1 endolytic transglycosylase MltG [Bacillota bacterium]